jgi:hypothetical protein
LFYCLLCCMNVLDMHKAFIKLASQHSAEVRVVMCFN